MRAHSLGVIFSPLRMYTETKDSVLVICFFFFFFCSVLTEPGNWQEGNYQP